MFNWLREAGHFTGDNPASGANVKLENERKYWRKEFLEQEQLGRLLEVAASSLKPIVLTAAFTGMRLGELKRVKKKDVNLDSCTIFIPESKNDEPGSPFPSPTAFSRS